VGGDQRDPQRSAAGKLKAAARHWADQRFGGPDELDEDLELFGLADQIKADGYAPFAVWLENKIAVEAFLELEWSWQPGSTANGMQRLQIPQDQIKHTLELMGVKRRQWPEVFNDVKVMQRAALLELHGEAE
jgi:hypothetical protein